MKTAIVGGGIIGITTGLALLEAGHDVTIFTREPVEKTTSFAAGAVIYPVNAEESDRTLRWFAATNKTLSEKNLPGVSRITWRKCSVQENCPEPFWLKSVGGGRLKDVPFGNKSGVGADLFLIDVDTYTPHLLAEFKKRGRYEIQNVASFDEIPAEYDVIVNCTGAFAGQLTDDQDIHPARGQIVLVKNPGVHEFYSSFDSKNYIYPRRDLCVLGGSFDEDIWDMKPDNELTRSILAWAGNIMPEFKNAEVADVRVGLRPIRSKVRLEKEILPSGRTVIHNYGHGGCGYTLSWGCAAEILALTG